MGIILLILLQNTIFGSYIAFRLYQAFFKKYNMWLVIIIFLILSSTFLIARVLVRTLGIHLPHSIVFATHLILGFTNYFFMYLVATDILRLIFKLLHTPFLSHTVQVSIVIILTLITTIYGYINSHNTKVTEYNITLNKNLKENFKIAAFSDLHIGADMSPKRLNKEINTINNMKPDIIFIVGDIVDNNIKDLTQAHLDELKKLSAPLGVYAVVGNHDYYSADINTIKNLLEQANINTLIDDVTYIEEKGFYIIGRDSLRHTNDNGSKRQNIQALYDKIEDKTKPLIILDHVPKGLEDGKKINADIQISGHTHDGQTFPLNLIVRKMTHLSHGMLLDDGFYYIVSSGIGLWGPPVRIGTNAEIIFINVYGRNTNP